MLIPLGILASSGAGVPPGDYELISTTVLGSNQASVVFDVSSFASTYKHLQIRAATRTSRTGFNNGGISLRFNGDTTSSYAGHQILGQNSAVSSFADTSQTLVPFAFTGASADTTANGFGGAVLDILDPYSTVKNTTTRSLSGIGGAQVLFTSGLFFKTDSITSITLLGLNSTNIIAGSRFSIYGVRG
jgi:hypothetical protein